MQPIPTYQQEFHIDPTAVDRFGRLKPSMVLLYAQEVAGHHCDLISLNYDDLEAKGLFWAIIRNRVQITRLPRVGETITLETWPMPTTRTAYPRSTVAYDEQGNEVFRCVSLWILMSRSDRTMVLPDKSGIVVEGALMGTELASPRSLAPKSLADRRCRTVAFTDLDRNGHMNNTKYLDCIADLFPSAFHFSHRPVEFTVCYLSEALEGQELILSWDALEDGTVGVDAHRQNGEKTERIFSARLSY